MAPDEYGFWDAHKHEATDEPDGLPDTLIVPVVETLRARGVLTLQSCQGHEGRSDGILWIAGRHATVKNAQRCIVSLGFDTVSLRWGVLGVEGGPVLELHWHPKRRALALARILELFR